jgi:hypothetical protein
MLRKEATIAVVVAVLLGGASLFGGLSTIPALAAIDPDSVEVAHKQISQDDKSTIIDSLELTAKKSTSRATGTVTIEIIKNDDVLRTATLGTSKLATTFHVVEVAIDNINMTGSFEILVSYVGSGHIYISDIDVLEGTETAAPDEEQPSANENPPSDDPDQQSAQSLENVIETKTISQAADASLTVKTVEFSAKKSTSRATGTLIIALVQDSKILDSTSVRTSALSTTFKDLQVSFGLNVKDDFQVVFMYEGSGRVTVSDIAVPGETTPPAQPPEEHPPIPPPTPEGTVQLVVRAIDQSGNKLGGLWVAVFQGFTLVKSGGTEATFSLDKGKTYMVGMDDFYDGKTGTLYDFNGWTDGTKDNRRITTLNSDAVFTAKYIVTMGAPPPPPPKDPPAGPPPSSPPGTITAFAYRMPDEHWGGTFVGAKAQMYFVLYNSTGYMIYGGYFDENGNKVTGLKDGQTYWIYATNCHHCHGGTHDVVFNHWENDVTENPRAVTPGMSAGAYYEYVPDTP